MADNRKGSKKHHLILAAKRVSEDSILFVLNKEPSVTVKEEDITWVIKSRKNVVVLIDRETGKVEVVGKKNQMESLLLGVGYGVPSLAEVIQLLKEAM